MYQWTEPTVVSGISLELSGWTEVHPYKMSRADGSFRFGFIGSAAVRSNCYSGERDTSCLDGEKFRGFV